MTLVPSVSFVSYILSMHMVEVSCCKINIKNFRYVSRTTKCLSIRYLIISLELMGTNEKGETLLLMVQK